MKLTDIGMLRRLASYQGVPISLEDCRRVADAAHELERMRAASVIVPCSLIPGHDVAFGPCVCGAWHRGETLIEEVGRLQGEVAQLQIALGVASGELADAQSIIARLPLTADGVVVLPPDRVWKKWDVLRDGQVVWIEGQGWGVDAGMGLADTVESCCSTREAAERAGGEKHDS